MSERHSESTDEIDSSSPLPSKIPEISVGSNVVKKVLRIDKQRDCDAAGKSRRLAQGDSY